MLIGLLFADDTVTFSETVTQALAGFKGLLCWCNVNLMSLNAKKCGILVVYKCKRNGTVINAHASTLASIVTEVGLHPEY